MLHHSSTVVRTQQEARDPEWDQWKKIDGLCFPGTPSEPCRETCVEASQCSWTFKVCSLLCAHVSLHFINILIIVKTNTPLHFDTDNVSINCSTSRLWGRNSQESWECRGGAPRWKAKLSISTNFTTITVFALNIAFLQTWRPHPNYLEMF